MSAPAAIEDLFDPRLLALQRLAVAIDRIPNAAVQDSLKHVKLWMECHCDHMTEPVARALLGIGIGE